jgi:hypothetical protein
MAAKPLKERILVQRFPLRGDEAMRLWRFPWPQLG